MRWVEIYSIPFMRDALLAGVLAGAVLGYLGLFVILRRIVFLGAALPHLAALGVAGAALAGASPLAGAVVGALVGASLLSFAPARGRVPPDGVIGLVYAIATAGAILLLAGSAAGETHILQILSGDILGTSAAEVRWMLGLFSGIALAHALLWKEFLLVSYDPEAAATMSFRLRLWDGILFLTLGAAVAFTLRVMGAVVTFAFLVGPAAAALLLFRRFAVIVPLAAGLGAAAAAAGLTLSFLYDLPAGPTIAACAVAPALPAALLPLLRRGG